MAQQQAPRVGALRALQDHCMGLRGFGPRTLGGVDINRVAAEIARITLANDSEEGLSDVQHRRVLHIKAELCQATAFMAHCAWQRAVFSAHAADRAAAGATAPANAPASGSQC